MDHEVTVTISVRKISGYNSEKVVHSEVQRLAEGDRLETELNDAVNDAHLEIDRQMTRIRKAERAARATEEV